jgi:F-type H+-transporting ATPase subunit gamma
MTKLRVNQLIAEGREVKIYCVGRKAYEQLKSAYGDKIIDHSFGVFKGLIDFKVAQDLAQKFTELYNQGVFDVGEVIYSKFKSAIAQEQINKQIIPAQIKFAAAEANLESPLSYEPSEEEVLTELLPKNLAMQIYNELLENSASEQGARMAAMEAASTNAGKMIKGLTLVYNRTRQANITKELIDIISGANTI